MRRPMLTVVGIFILVMGQGYALADTKTVMIGRRDGGQLLAHIHEGIEMIRKGYSYRIIGDQYSAAPCNCCTSKAVNPPGYAPRGRSDCISTSARIRERGRQRSSIGFQPSSSEGQISGGSANCPYTGMASRR
jgi:hypothetical protein